MPYSGMTDARTGLRNALARRGKIAASPAPAAIAPASAKAPAKSAQAGIGSWIPKTAAEKASFKIGTDRVLAVMNHHSFPGREKLAVTLLCNPRLSAPEIGTLLAVADAAPDKQDAALADMRAALAEAKRHNANAASGAVKPTLSGSAAVWAKAYERAGIIGESAQ